MAHAAFPMAMSTTRPAQENTVQRALHGGVRLHGAQTCADDLVSGIAKRHKICPFRSKAFCRQCIT